MKKILNLCLIMTLSLVILMTSNVYAAISYKVNVTAEKEEYSKGEEFVVDVNITNLKTSKGIIAFGAKLDYDKNNLTLVKMEGKNGWDDPKEENLSYYAQSGKLAITRAGVLKTDETIFTITFKVKGNKASINTISLKEIAVGDGTTLSEIGDVVATKKNTTNIPTTPTKPTNPTVPTNPSKPLDVNDSTGNNGSENSGNIGQSSTENKKNENSNGKDDKESNKFSNSKSEIKDNMVKDSKLPQTGESTWTLLLLETMLVSVAGISIVGLRRIKKNDG